MVTTVVVMAAAALLLMYTAPKSFDNTIQELGCAIWHNLSGENNNNNSNQMLFITQNDRFSLKIQLQTIKEK